MEFEIWNKFIVCSEVIEAGSGSEDCHRLYQLETPTTYIVIIIAIAIIIIVIAINIITITIVDIIINLTIIIIMCVMIMTIRRRLFKGGADNECDQDQW